MHKFYKRKVNFLSSKGAVFSLQNLLIFILYRKKMRILLNFAEYGILLLGADKETVDLLGGMPSIRNLE